MKRNLQKARAAMQRWRSWHPDIKLARAREYYVGHREEIIRKASAYAREHPEVVRSIRNNRRCREAGAAGRSTVREWSELVRQYGGRCAYCGADGTLVPDHGLPLARGGSNWTSNIFPACPSCNWRKHTLTVAEYRERRRAEGLYVRSPLPREVLSELEDGASGRQEAPLPAPSRRRR